MEGMIWNANKVLTQALDPGVRGINKAFFMDCAGIAIVSMVQVGAIFSGTVGSGIFLKHNPDGTWSNPVAVGMSRVGFGLLFGAQIKDVIIFMPDDKSVETFFSTGAEISDQLNLTIAVGREMDGTLGVSGTGLSANLCVAYTKGAYAAIAVEGAVVGPRTKTNTHFYGEEDPQKIVYGGIPFPADKVTLIDDVKAKLSKCAAGLSEKPGEGDKAKVEAALDHANAAGAQAPSHDHVVIVNAEEEAAKEAAAWDIAES